MFAVTQALPCLGGLLSPGHYDLTGPDGFDDFKLGEHREGGIDLGRLSVDHGDHGGRCEVDGFAAVVVDDLQGLGAFLFAGQEFDQKQFFDDGVRFGVLDAVKDIDQFGNLEDDLLKTCRVTADANRHS